MEIAKYSYTCEKRKVVFPPDNDIVKNTDWLKHDRVRIIEQLQGGAMSEPRASRNRRLGQRSSEYDASVCWYQPK